MIKHLKEKKQFTKIVAFFMAVVMVVSVLYVSNSKSEVMAGDGDQFCIMKESLSSFITEESKNSIIDNDYKFGDASINQVNIDVPAEDTYVGLTSNPYKGSFAIDAGGGSSTYIYYAIVLSESGNFNDAWEEENKPTVLTPGKTYYMHFAQTDSNYTLNGCNGNVSSPIAFRIYVNKDEYTPTLKYDNVKNTATVSHYSGQYATSSYKSNYYSSNCKVRYKVDTNPNTLDSINTFDDDVDTSWTTAEGSGDYALTKEQTSLLDDTVTEGTYYAHAILVLEEYGSWAHKVIKLGTSPACIKNIKTAELNGGTTIKVNGGDPVGVALQAADDARYFSNGNPDKFDLDLTDKTFNWYDDIYINFVTEQAANELVIVPNRVSDTNSVWITYNGSSSNGKTGLTETYSFYVGSDTSDKHADCGPATNVVVKYNYTDTKPSVTDVKIDGTQYGGNAPFSGTAYYTDKDTVTFDVAVKNPSADRRPIIDVCSEDGTHKKEHLDLVEGQTEYTFSSMTYDLKEGINKITVKALNTKSTDDNDEEVLYSDSYQFIVIKDTTAPTFADETIKAQTGSSPYKDADTTDNKYTSYLDTDISYSITEAIGLKEVYVASYNQSGAEIDWSTATKLDVTGTEFTIPANTSNAGKTKYYKLKAVDKAGNEGFSKEIAVQFYDDKIEIKNIKLDEDENDTVDKFIKTVSSSTLTFDVESTEKVTKATVTIDGTDYEYENPTVNGNVYTFQGTVSATTSTSMDIKINAKNDNGVAASEETVKVLVFDLNDPGLTWANLTAGSNLITDVDSFNTDDWYTTIILRFTASDEGTGENFGIDKISISQTNSEGTTPSELTTLTDSYYQVTVVPSTDITGTNVKVEAVDKAGRKSTPFNKTFHVDAANPEITKLKLYNGEYEQASGYIFVKGDTPYYTYTVSDNIKVANISLDGGAAGTVPANILNINNPSDEELSKTIELTGLTESAYDYTLTVTDLAGQKATENLSFIYDDVAPTVSVVAYDIGAGKVTGDPVTAGVNAEWQKSMKLYIKASDKYFSHLVINVNGTETELSKADYKAALNSDDEYELDVPETVLGSEEDYTTAKTKISIKAVDTSLNESSYTADFKVDKTAPEIVNYSVNGTNISELGTDAYFTGDPTVKIELTDNIAVKEFKNTTKLGTAAEVLEADTTSNSINIEKKLSELMKVTTLEDGKYTLTLSDIKDVAGNTTATASIEGSIILDNTKPNAEIVAYTANEGTKQTGIPDVDKSYKSLVLTIEATDAGSGVDTVVYSIDGGADETATLTDGKFDIDVPESTAVTGTVIKVKVTDKMGLSDEFTYTYKVDKTAPEIDTFTIDGNNVEGLTSATFLSGDPEFKIKITENLEIDSYTITVTPSTGSPVKVESKVEDTKKLSEILGTTEYEDGAYTVTLEAVDKAGNDATSITGEFSIDNTKPGLEIVGSQSNIYGDATGVPEKDSWYKQITLNLKASDAGAGVKKAEITNGKVTSTQELEGTDGTFNIIVEPSETISGTTIKVKVYDCADEENYDEFTYVYKVDKTNPDNLSLTVDGKPAKDVNNTTIGGASLDPQIGFEFSDNIQVKSYKLEVIIPSGETKVVDNLSVGSDKATYSKKLSEIIGGAPKDGAYTVTVNGADLAGNTLETASVKFTLDNTKPQLVSLVLNGEKVNVADIPNREASKYAYKTLKLSANATDGTSGVATYKIEQYLMNGGSWELVQTDDFNGNCGDVTIKESKTEAGTKVVITIGDKMDNKVSYTYYFLADETAPDSRIDVDDSAFSKSKDSYLKGNPTIVTSDSDNIKVNVRTMTIEMPFEIDGSNTVVLTKDFIGSNNLGKLIGTTPKDGKYTITVYSEDRSLNNDSGTVSFTLDNTAPVNSMKITTANPPKYSKFNFKSYDGTVYGTYYNSNVVLNIECADTNVDVITVTDNGSKTSLQATEGTNSAGVKTKNGNVTITGEGTHTVVVESKDKAGNVGTSRTLSFVIDRTNPVVSLTLNGSSVSDGAQERYLNTNATVHVSVSETNKDAADNKRVVKMTRPSAATNTSTDVYTEGNNTYDTEADYVVTYSAIDCAGNESVAKSVAFRVDKTAPQLKISGVAEGSTSNKSVTVTYSMVEAFYWDMPSAEVKIYKKVDGQGEKLLKTVQYSAKNANSSMNETFTEDGEYRFDFTAEDKCGNKANTSYSFILDQTAPIIELDGVGNYDKTVDPVKLKLTITEDFYTTNTLEVKGTRTGIDGKEEKISLDLPSVKKAKTTVIENEFTEDGIYDLTVTSTDKAGNKTEKTLHFTIDTEDPILKELPEYDNTTINSFKWDYEYDDLVTDLTVCDITVFLDGVEYDGISEITDGKHILKITAKDELGHEVSREYEFLLDTKSPVVIITGIEDGQKILEAATVNISTQIGEDILDSVTVNGVEQTITDNNCTFTADKVGKYEVVIKAHDNAGNQTETKLNFEFGKKFNPLWVIIPAAILLLLIILIIILKKKGDKEEKRLS